VQKHKSTDTYSTGVLASKRGNMSFVLNVEVKNVKSGVDKYEQPIVDLVLRTTDFQAMLMAKYIAEQKPAQIKVVE
jgi:hypothetical protein